MNAMLQIQIRVSANQARREIASVGTAMKAAQRAANSGGAARPGMMGELANTFGMAGTAAGKFAGSMDNAGARAGNFFRSLSAHKGSLAAFGKNMQWTGRQLEFNFTLPLVAAGYFATKWALANEAATVKVKKVYGDLSFTQERINNETKALSTTFELLSTRFGVNQAEVIGVAAAWAAAGSAGRGLGENTRATLEAMIIGEMDAKAATEALISIMATYRLSSKKAANGTSELGSALADINIIENQTGISFSGLIDVIQRSGGAASVAGVDIRHLAAMAAALVPATGSATTAGNALRTMISRLQAPTRDTVEILEKMGISVMSKDWLGKNATQKIETLAEKFGTLSGANKTLVSSIVASRWQVNRFSRLMEDIGSKTGYYQKALDATSERATENGKTTRQQAVYWRELGTVLDSNPKKFDILTTSIKNNLTSAMVPLLPAIASVLATISNLAQAFADLDPKTQKFIMFALLFVAVVGPWIRLAGATILLFSSLGSAIMWVGVALAWMGKTALNVMAKLFVLPARWTQGWGTSEMGRVEATNAANAAIVASGETTAVGLAGAAQTATTAWIAAFESIIVGAETAAYATTTAWSATFASIVVGSDGVATLFAGHQMLMAGSSTEAAGTMLAVWEGAAATISAVWDAIWGPMALGMGAVAEAAQAAAAATAAAWTQAGVIMGQIGAGFTATMLAAPAEILALNTGAATGTGNVWVVGMTRLVETFVISGGQIVSVWAGVMGETVTQASLAGGAIGSVWMGTMQGLVEIIGASNLWIAGQQEIVVAPAVAAAAAVAAAWEAEAEASAAATYTSRALMAGSQSTVIEAALVSATATAQAWNSSAVAVANMWGIAIPVVTDAQLAVPTIALSAATATAEAWTASAIAVAEMWGIAFPLVAEAQVLVPEIAVGASTVTAEAWTASALAVAEMWGISMAVTAGAQAAVPTAAIPAAAATAGVWTTAAAKVRLAWAATMVGKGGIFTLMLAPLKMIIVPLMALLSFIGQVLMIGVTAIAAVLGAPVWAVVAVIVAAVALIVLILKTDFEDPIIRVLKSVVHWFAQLPKVFSQVLSAVARVVSGWVRAIVDFLSYLNPFAKHSPSLVDNVRAGVSTILDEYGRLKGIGKTVLDAAKAHAAFQEAIAGTQAGFDATKRGQDRAEVAKVAPAALPAFDALGVQIDALKAAMIPLAAQIAVQQAITARWQSIVDRLSDSLERETRILDDLTKQLNDLDDQISAATGEIERLGNMDLPGMRAMEDQIFANEMAQKALRLELLRMEEGGQSIEDLRSKMEDLAGLIEILRGEREGLRMAGAGSDVLDTYDAEIAALEAEQAAIQDQGDAIQDMTKELEKLQNQAEIMDLEKALAFDGPLRQIDQMIDGLNEMPFDEIVASIGEQQDLIAVLQPQYDAIAAALERQQQIVDHIQVAYDAANASLKEEQTTLDGLESAYSDISALIRDMERSMVNFSSATKEAQSLAEQLFDAGLGVDDFAQVGGDLLDPEGFQADIDKMNEDLQKEIDEMMKGMEGLKFPNPFAWIGEKWNEFTTNFGLGIGVIKGWWNGFKEDFGRGVDVIKEKWNKLIDPIKEKWKELKEDFDRGVESIKEKWNNFVDAFKRGWHKAVDPIKKGITDLKDDFVRGFQTIKEKLMDVWDTIKVYVIPIFQSIWSIILIGVALVVLAFVWLKDKWDEAVEKVKEKARQLKEKFDEVMASIKKWIDENIVPAFVWLKDKWDEAVEKVKEKASQLKEKFDEVMGSMKKWIDEKIVGSLQAFAGFFAGIWDGVVENVKGAWSKIKGFLVGGVNFLIGIFNKVAGFINGISEKLHLKVHIDPMPPLATGEGGSLSSLPTMASGAVIPAAPVGGFHGKQARAIVAEGSRIHREFVIPTDPKYRTRAQSLFTMLAKDIGMPVATPQMARGGIPGSGGSGDRRGFDPGNQSDPLDDLIKFVRQVGNIFSGVGNIGIDFLKDIALYLKDLLLEWTGKLFGGDREINGRKVRLGAAGLIMQEGIPQMASGGTIVGHTPGGVLMRVGEGRYDEKVQVIPLRGNENGGKREVHFHGDLVFPNVTDGSDAEDFIKNLETLAGV